MSGFGAALRALDEVGVVPDMRKPHEPAHVELDIWIERSDIPAADAALRAAGFHHFAAPGAPGHRFYLGVDDGRWLKLDAKLRAGGARPWFVRMTARIATWNGRRPLSLRRLGPVVAVLGPDGAGKGTVLEALDARIPVAVTRVYLGGRQPRDRGGRTATRTETDGGRQAGPTALRETLFLIWRALPVWLRLARAYGAAWRGHVVLCDRHPIEVLVTRPPRTRLGGLVDRALSVRLVPWPDAIVVLDAPGDVLFARKGEHSPVVLERWRQGYRELLDGREGRIVSTAQPLEHSAREASNTVWQVLCARRRW